MSKNFVEVSINLICKPNIWDFFPEGLDRVLLICGFWLYFCNLELRDSLA